MYGWAVFLVHSDINAINHMWKFLHGSMSAVADGGLVHEGHISGTMDRSATRIERNYRWFII